jgi:plasmid maintenance system antidote protein VapI
MPAAAVATVTASADALGVSRRTLSALLNGSLNLAVAGEEGWVR